MHVLVVLPSALRGFVGNLNSGVCVSHWQGVIIIDKFLLHMHSARFSINNALSSTPSCCADPFGIAMFLPLVKFVSGVEAASSPTKSVDLCTQAFVEYERLQNRVKPPNLASIRGTE